MARLVNLDEDGDSEAGPPNYPILDVLAIADEPAHEPRPDPNLSSFTAALSCYPIVSQLTSYIDLLTLSELARTCRHVRENLLQHRKILIKQTLRCENETSSGDPRNSYPINGYNIGRLTSGKVGACANDMNCVAKAPPTHLLKLRYRRLCRTCMKSPLERLTIVSRTIENDHESNDDSTPEKRIFTRSPCNCEDAIWICGTCTQSMRADDTTYLRGWTWRNRYSHCGGMGAGLGEGNEGVQCGRTSDCLAATLVLKDVECDAVELAHLQADAAKAELQGRHWNGGSYTTQEMLGLGDTIKTKAKKFVPVGAVVKQYEDEKGSSFLGREQTGANRTWCSWCDRVVLSIKDKDRAGRSTDSIVSSSSLSEA